MKSHVSSRSKCWLRFGTAVGSVALIWGVVLPWLGSLRPVRQRIECNEAKHINPDALFYTDLEAMPAILDRVEDESHEGD